MVLRDEVVSLGANLRSIRATSTELHPRDGGQFDTG